MTDFQRFLSNMETSSYKSEKQLSRKELFSRILKVETALSKASKVIKEDTDINSDDILAEIDVIKMFAFDQSVDIEHLNQGFDNIFGRFLEIRESFNSKYNNSHNAICESLNDVDGSETEEPEYSTALKVETSFEEEYPFVNKEDLLTAQYEAFINEVDNKPFFKIIKKYFEDYLMNRLDVVNRDFLWDLIKAISSTITHLAIEAGNKPSSILLFESYYNSLVSCLNNVVHASNDDDILASYEWMTNFLGIGEGENTLVLNPDESI